MSNLAWFCRYRNENYNSKLLKSTTTMRFFSFVLNSFLRANCRSRKPVDAKYVNDKSRGENKN